MNFPKANFSGANLQKSSFQSSLLTGASFANANLEKADFRNAKNYFIDPRFVKMKEAQFSFPEAIVLLQALGVLVEF
ncbi:pentapeptide repeat-containing protein [Bdellovibrio sp. BCCA]|uniref:pentapeptide repeat-containing protein n=1 Tax=Bdellovibrio sp. BCCA TaxID=3136281 RepID=UPI0030F0493A